MKSLFWLNNIIILLFSKFLKNLQNVYKCPKLSNIFQNFQIGNFEKWAMQDILYFRPATESTFCPRAKSR